MKILIIGGDGYLGWPTAMYFSKRGHEVIVLDSLVKRTWEAMLDIKPLRPLSTLHKRVRVWKEVTGLKIEVAIADLATEGMIDAVLEHVKPDVIIHYGEQPSAPFSMKNPNRCVETMRNNVEGTLRLIWAMKEHCPDAHLIKLGSMGEYGTPGCEIPEGFIEETCSRHSFSEHYPKAYFGCQLAGLPFPKSPGSFYHLSKVHDSNNLMFAAKLWGLKVTDLNQGIVYGIDTDETVLHPDLHTSFHYDSIFGTVLNRFCVQAVMGIPLTVYGSGGQKRTFLNIKDTLQCVDIASQNPPEKGEFQVFNQYTEIFSVNSLANIVTLYGDRSVWANIYENPREESEDHYFLPKNDKFTSLGLNPSLLDKEVIQSMLSKISEHKDNINLKSIQPEVKWK